MSRVGKPCCNDCGKGLKEGARYCHHCGTPAQSLGKSFYAESDPNVRERMWNSLMAPVLEPMVTKAAPKPERDPVAEAAQIEAMWADILAPYRLKPEGAAEQAWADFVDQFAHAVKSASRSAEPSPAEQAWAAVANKIKGT